MARAVAADGQVVTVTDSGGERRRGLGRGRQRHEQEDGGEGQKPRASSHGGHSPPKCGGGK